jgi:centrobin
VPVRKQLQELNGQHQQELATQLAQFKVEMAEREERQQQVAQDYELRYWSWRSLLGPVSFHE